MAGFAPPKQFRGAGDLRTQLNANWRYLSAYLNRDTSAWIEYTPTTTGLTLGNGTAEGRYQVSNGIVVARVKVTLGSTSSIASAPRIDLPPVAPNTEMHEASVTDVGIGICRNDGSTTFPARAKYIDTLVFELRIGDAEHSSTWLEETTVSSTRPFTWGDGDYMIANLCYEAAL